MALTIRARYTARKMRAVCLLILSATTLHSFAATPTASPTTVTATAPVTPSAPGLTKSAESKPLWTELTPLQQQILEPLAHQWSKWDSNHKSKWITISNKYQSMNPEQQKRLQDNIRDWANMTPEQHRLARESYARAKKLNTEQKTTQWQQYQQLSEEQKQKLAADAATKKRVANVPALQTRPKLVEPIKSAKKTSLAHTTPAAKSAVTNPVVEPATPNTPTAPVVAPPTVTPPAPQLINTSNTNNTTAP